MFLMSSLMVGLFFNHHLLPRPIYYLLWASELILAISMGVIVHNHRHVSIWKGQLLNRFTDCWLTLLYGYPVFGWIPTHLQNHHIHTNQEPDYTKTYAYSEKNNLWTLIYYPMYSGVIQQKAIGNYLKRLRVKDRARYKEHLLQIILIILFLIMAILIDWKSALLYVILPHQISLNSVLIFNYVQHVHADEESDFNHSRNIEGFLNVFLFNNGFHTAHHIKPNLHWSRLPEFHAQIRSKIDPSLIEKNLIWFLIRQYLISPFYPSWASRSMRSQRNLSLSPK